MSKTAQRSFSLLWEIDPVKLKRKLIKSCPVLIEDATPEDKYLLHINNDTDVDIFNIHNIEQCFTICTDYNITILCVSDLSSLAFAINFVRDFHNTNGIPFLDKKGNYRVYMDKFMFELLTKDKTEKFMSTKNLKTVEDNVVVEDISNKKGKGRPKKIEVEDISNKKGRGRPKKVETVTVKTTVEKDNMKVDSIKSEKMPFVDMFKVVTKNEDFKEQIKNNSVFTLSHDTLSKVMGEELSPAKVKKVVEHLSEKFTVFQNKETKDIFFFKKAVSLKQKNFKA